MGKSKYASIDEYIEASDEKNRGMLYELKGYILQAAPDAIEMFNYGVPAFALVKGGKLDQQIMIAGFKNHVGLYPHPTTIDHFEEELKQYKQGKGSIQFEHNKPLPKELIIKMVEYRRKLVLNEID